MGAMGRQKKHNTHLPPRMLHRHGAYWHTPRLEGRQRWERLSSDFGESMRMYYQREQRTLAGSTVHDAIARYEREVLPGHAPKTQYDYSAYLGRLRPIFGESKLCSVRRSDVAQYLDRRSAKIAANREVACLSSVFRNAIRWGWCEENPCLGAPRNTERRRTRLPSEAELAAIRVAASAQIGCMVDLVLLIGIRKGDLLKIRLSDMTSQGLLVVISKTSAEAIFQWTDALRDVIDRARRLRRRVGSMYLFANRKGQRYTPSGWDCIWRRTLVRAGVKGLTFHDLRRLVITQAQRERGLDYAQAVGVHQSRSSTERYIVRGPVVVKPLR